MIVNELRNNLRGLILAINTQQGLEKVQSCILDVLGDQAPVAAVAVASATASPVTSAATVKERAESIEITFDEDDEVWEVALELCDEILDSLDDLPERAEEFVESVREKTENIRDWIEEHEDVTDTQMTALENMKGGVERWQR